MTFKIGKVLIVDPSLSFASLFPHQLINDFPELISVLGASCVSRFYVFIFHARFALPPRWLLCDLKLIR